MPKTQGDLTITVQKIETGHLTVCVLGTEPIIMNRMSEKARHDLLAPRGRLTSVEKATNQKHDPLREFRASIYRDTRSDAPTLIQLPSTAFKGAMGTAALDLPGTKKAQIGRLVKVDRAYVSVYGVPQLHMSVVRSADMNKTPDIRTRAILPQWAAVVDISFARPLITEQAIANLMSAAGLVSGVGDWRSEKGKGNFGSYEVVNADDLRFVEVLAAGREAQVAAMETAVPFDDETSELLSWFHTEMTRRTEQGKIAKPVRAKKEAA